MIADDHAVVRRGLIQIISSEPDMEVSVEACDGDEAFQHLRLDTWDIAILDVAMPGKNILELLKLAKLERFNKPILILSMYPEDEYAMRLLRAGADGYLNKESAPEQLVSVIRKLVKGGRYVSPELTDILLDEVLTNKPNLHHQLTDREFQVFISLAKGKRLTDIADSMALSIKTVSTYRTRILSKMNLKNNADIIHYAIENNIED